MDNWTASGCRPGPVLEATIAKVARSHVYHTQLCCSVQPLFFLCSPQGKKCVSRDQRLEEFAGSCSLYLLWLLAGCSRQSDPVFRDSLCKFSLTRGCLLHISIILFLRASACFVFFPNYYLCVWCALAPCLMVLCCFLAFPSVSSESFVFCWVYTVNRYALLKKKRKKLMERVAEWLTCILLSLSVIYRETSVKKSPRKTEFPDKDKQCSGPERCPC